MMSLLLSDARETLQHQKRFENDVETSRDVENNIIKPSPHAKVSYVSSAKTSARTSPQQRTNERPRLVRRRRTISGVTEEAKSVLEQFLQLKLSKYDSSNTGSSNKWSSDNESTGQSDSAWLRRQLISRILRNSLEENESNHVPSTNEEELGVLSHGRTKPLISVHERNEGRLNVINEGSNSILDDVNSAQLKQDHVKGHATDRIRPMTKDQAISVASGNTRTGLVSDQNGSIATDKAGTIVNGNTRTRSVHGDQSRIIITLSDRVAALASDLAKASSSDQSRITASDQTRITASDQIRADSDQKRTSDSDEVKTLLKENTSTTKEPSTIVNEHTNASSATNGETLQNSSRNSTNSTDIRRKNRITQLTSVVDEFSSDDDEEKEYKSRIERKSKPRKKTLFERASLSLRRSLNIRLTPPEEEKWSGHSRNPEKRNENGWPEDSKGTLEKEKKKKKKKRKSKNHLSCISGNDNQTPRSIPERGRGIERGQEVEEEIDDPPYQAAVVPSRVVEGKRIEQPAVSPKRSSSNPESMNYGVHLKRFSSGGSRDGFFSDIIRSLRQNSKSKRKSKREQANIPEIIHPVEQKTSIGEIKSLYIDMGRKRLAADYSRVDQTTGGVHSQGQGRSEKAIVENEGERKQEPLPGFKHDPSYGAMYSKLNITGDDLDYVDGAKLKTIPITKLFHERTPEEKEELFEKIADQLDDIVKGLPLTACLFPKATTAGLVSIEESLLKENLTNGRLNTSNMNGVVNGTSIGSLTRPQNQTDTQTLAAELAQTDSYGSFSTVFNSAIDTSNNSAGSKMTQVQQLGFLFQLAHSAVQLAGGLGTAAATSIKDMTIRYFEDRFASWVVDNGGWESLVEETSTDSELD